MAVVGNVVKGTININYKAIIEALIEAFIEVFSKIIAKRNIISIRSQIVNQLSIL